MTRDYGKKSQGEEAHWRIIQPLTYSTQGKASAVKHHPRRAGQEKPTPLPGGWPEPDLVTVSEGRQGLGVCSQKNVFTDSKIVPQANASFLTIFSNYTPILSLFSFSILRWMLLLQLQTLLRKSKNVQVFYHLYVSWWNLAGERCITGLCFPRTIKYEHNTI